MSNTKREKKRYHFVNFRVETKGVRPHILNPNIANQSTKRKKMHLRVCKAKYKFSWHSFIGQNLSLYTPIKLNHYRFHFLPNNNDIYLRKKEKKKGDGRGGKTQQI